MGCLDGNDTGNLGNGSDPLQDLVDGIVLHERVGAASRGNFLQVNPAICRLLGYTEAEMKALTPLDIMAPEDRQVVPQDAEAMARDGVLRHNKALVSKDGRSVPTEIVTRQFEQDGRTMVMSVIRDVTERKRAEEALRLSAETFAKTFQGNASAMALTRLADGRVINVNERWVEITGFSREETVGQTTTGLGIWKHADDRTAMICALRERGMVRDQEYACFRKNRQEWTALMSAQLITVQGEQVVVTSAIDITDRKRAEEGLRQMNAELERRVGEKTAELRRANETLEQRVAERAGEIQKANEELESSRRAALNLMDDAIAARQQAEQAAIDVARRAEELRALNLDLERFNRAAVDRELRMIELKKQVNDLCARLGEPRAYEMEGEREESH